MKSVEDEIQVIVVLDGDLGGYANAKACYMKQKHRMIWERRHGPVGSGMKGEEAGAVTDE